MPRAAVVRLPERLRAPAQVAVDVSCERLRRSFSRSQWHALAAGQVVAEVSGAEDKRARAAGLVQFTPQEVWPTLVDFESRPKYLPGAQEIRTVRVEANRVWLAEHVRVLFVSIHYQVINTLDPEGGSVSWVLDDTVEHDIAGTTGSWQLAPIAERRQTLVIYSNRLDIGRPVPRTIESFLLQRSLPQMINGLRNELQRRLGQRAG
jgi:carbon monoxide dehydrogenase subunit G